MLLFDNAQQVGVRFWYSTLYSLCVPDHLNFELRNCCVSWFTGDGGAALKYKACFQVFDR